VLDLGCGQGVLGRALAALGVASLGIDASPALIAAAQARAGALERHQVGDIRRLAAAGLESVDHAVLLMVVQDLDPIEPVLEAVANLLKPGGRLVMVLTHPCFRAPRRSGWGWDDLQRAQYRRIDGYLSPYQVSLATHPGAAAGSAEAALRTASFHRPISEYLNALGSVGLPVVACDELCNPRRGTKGTRFAAEDRAAHEIPLFLALTAQRVRLGGGAG
jgi:SAM-dependent methyltransferase